MSDNTVAKLAEVVGTPTDKLLKQMADAGLPQKSASDSVSDAEKATLLAHLKKAHGQDAEAEPSRVTLKRKTNTTLKLGGGRGGKTVAVEVRKKRTYVRRDTPESVEPEAPEVEEAPVAAVTEVTPEPIVEPVVEKAPEPVIEPTPEPVVEEKAPEPEPEPEQPAPEPEVKAEKPKVQLKRTEIPMDDLDRLAAARRASRERREAEAVESELRKKKKADDEARAKAAAEAKAIADAQAKAAAPAAAPAPDSGRADRRGRGAGRDGGNNNSGDRFAKKGRGGRGNGREERKPKGKKLRGGEAVAELQQANQFQAPTAPIVREVIISGPITPGEIAQQMAVKSGEVIKTLMKMGTMATINQAIDEDTAEIVIEEMGHISKRVAENAAEEAIVSEVQYDEAKAAHRAPVVTVMGHVDHGKTSLLDRIRETRVTAGEAGGITQHIGAYHVNTPNGMVTFIDTPGHAAFTAMRARGAQVTDIVILVVAADDGVMPQTEEAVQHARAGGVPIVVAVNKMDKEQADPDRVKNELAQRDVIPEEWGGDTQFVPVSAMTGMGIDDLLEAVLLQSELLELTAVADGPATGTVVESRLDKGRGPVATVLVQNGTLKKGDVVLAGDQVGKVRTLIDENGVQTASAGPSIPVEILGLAGTPDAGDNFLVVESERKAREVAEFRRNRAKEQEQRRQQAAKLDQMFANMGADEVQVLNIVLKTDVRGTLEALTAQLEKLSTEEVKVNVISSGVGGITGSDANLALSANAVILGFNVRADSASRKIIERENVDLRYYSVIYDIIDDVKSAMSGMLSPELREEIVGVAEVRDVFNSPKFGQVAGCMVVEGTVYRQKRIRVLRSDIVIYEGELESLRRFKDDVQEVRNNMECGIAVKAYNDVKPGDKIEVFDTKEFARTL